MKTLITSYLLSLISMLILDFVWIGVIAKKFYANYLLPITGGGFNIAPAAVFYLLYPVGLLFLVIDPALKSGTPLVKVFLLGALLGLVAYGSYDLTNHATIKNWSLLVTIVDMAWGTLVSGVVGVLVVTLVRRFF